MKRRRPILAAAATGLSPALCCATIGVWIRSYFGSDFNSTLQGTGFSVDASHDQLVVIHHRVDGNDSASYLTCHFSRSQGTLYLLVNGLFLDPNSVPHPVPEGPPNVQALRSRDLIVVLSRPYYQVKLPANGELKNGYDFGLTIDHIPPWPGGHTARFQAFALPLLVSGAPDLDRTGAAIVALAKGQERRSEPWSGARL